MKSPTVSCGLTYSAKITTKRSQTKFLNGFNLVKGPIPINLSRILHTIPSSTARRGGEEEATSTSDHSLDMSRYSKELLEELTDPQQLGTRGEPYFIAQIALILLLLFPPTGITQIVDSLGHVLFVCGLSLIVLGSYNLGTNLTPLPKPRDAEKHTLITNGAYAFVRHPLYTGVLSSSLGLTLATGNEARLAITALLFYLLDRKSAYEEECLVERYGSEYTVYQSKVKKLIPWLY